MGCTLPYYLMPCLCPHSTVSNGTGRQPASMLTNTWQCCCHVHAMLHLPPSPSARAHTCTCSSNNCTKAHISNSDWRDISAGVRAGKGHMLWKLFSALTLVNFGGREIDQSALVRYLSEAVWFPTALLPSRTLRWEALDSDSARATLVHGGLCVSAVFHFNARGQIVRLTTTDRPRSVAASRVLSYTGACKPRRACNAALDICFLWTSAVTATMQLGLCICS